MQACILLPSHSLGPCWQSKVSRPDPEREVWGTNIQVGHHDIMVVKILINYRTYVAILIIEHLIILYEMLWWYRSVQEGALLDVKTQSPRPWARSLGNKLDITALWHRGDSREALLAVETQLPQPSVTRLGNKNCNNLFIQNISRKTKSDWIFKLTKKKQYVFIQYEPLWLVCENKN